MRERLRLPWVACLLAVSVLAVGSRGAPGQALGSAAERQSGAAGAGGEAGAGDAGTLTLHVYEDLIQIPTLILSMSLEPVAPIASDRFWVSLDEGRRFRPSYVRVEGDDPLALTVLLDRRDPAGRLPEGLLEDLAAMAPADLHAADHVALYAMGCGLVRSAGVFSANRLLLRRDLERVVADAERLRAPDHTPPCRGEIGLWDSLRFVVAQQSDRPGRHVVLVVTDGLDGTSRYTAEETRMRAVLTGTAVFALRLPPTLSARTESFAQSRRRGALLPGSRGEDELQEVCELTGGMVLPTKNRTLPEVLHGFAEALRHRYIVEFPRAESGAGGSHSIAVYVAHARDFVRPSGISVPVVDERLRKDPTTVPNDPARHPTVMGNRRILPP